MLIKNVEPPRISDIDWGTGLGFTPCFYQADFVILLYETSRSYWLPRDLTLQLPMPITLLGPSAGIV